VVNVSGHEEWREHTGQLWQANPNVAYVMIGRNVGGQPMSDWEWETVRASVRATLAVTVGVPNFEVVGPGGSWDGVVGDTAVFVVFDPGAGVGRLWSKLARLARLYRRESIALAFGCGELVNGKAE